MIYRHSTVVEISKPGATSKCGAFRSISSPPLSIAPSGTWLNVEGIAEPPLSLGDLDYSTGTLRWPQHRAIEPEAKLSDYLRTAEYIFEEAQKEPHIDVPPLEVTEDFEELRWFLLPGEGRGPDAAEGRRTALP